MYRYTLRTYATRLTFASPEDRQRLIQTLEVQRDMVNECSKVVFELTKKQRRLSIMDVHTATYRPLREAYPHVPCQVAIKAQQECKGAYQSAYSNDHELTKAVTKTALSMRLDCRLYSWKGEHIRLTAIGGSRIECGLALYPKLRAMFASAEVRDPLLYVRDGEVWLGIPFVTPEPLHMENHCIGIDLGCRMLAVTSDGKAISGKAFCKAKRRLRYLRRHLQSKAMAGSKTAKRHLKRLRRREARYTLNYTHHVANELLKTDANTLVMENLTGIKRRGGKARGSRARVSQIPFYLLKTLLDYKAQARGKRVVTVPAHNTSKEDCRGIERGERRGRRYYTCDGYVFDAELNAAINIGARYEARTNHPVSLVMPFDGSLKPYGQGLVNGPIVGDSILVSDHRDGVALQAFTGS